MIKRVEIENFKKFKDISIDLKPSSLSIAVGGNNSGKSSLLQALALWNYAKSFILFFKGRDALSENSKKDGVGIGFDDFTPINIPSYQYLWNNLNASGGYTLKIKIVWDDLFIPNNEKYLQIALSLVQDRLYAKKSDSNLSDDDFIPEIAYLPPFAGITEKESWMSNADRRKQIGKGLSGSVLRNLIYDYFVEYTNSKDYEGIKEVARKKQLTEKKRVFDESNFGKINNILAEVFSVQLFPEVFSQEFHNYLRIPLKKGTWENDSFKLLETFTARDIMAEGRGFLQWLNTFCLLFDSKINVLLLDEPDAHLHATLQTELVRRLDNYLMNNDKQIIIATHSSEVIKSVEPSIILNVSNNKATYCSTDTEVRKILLGIGVEHFPFLHKIQQNKKIIFVEADFDKLILERFAKVLSINIPNGIVFWPMANKHKARKQLYLHLQNQIKGLKVISLEDKDNAEYKTTKKNLTDGQMPDDGNFLARKWRRWELESYLIHPLVLSKICKVTEDTIIKHLEDEFSLIWPKDYKQSDRTNTNAPLFDRDGKTIIEYFEKKYKFNKYNLPSFFTEAEVPDDIITMLNDIVKL